MIGDLILLLIYKETGLIEAMPVLTGVVLLNIAIYQKRKGDSLCGLIERWRT